MDGKPLIQHFADDLQAVVDKYRNQGLTIGEAIGAIEIVKLDLYEDLQEDDEATGIW